MKRASGPGLPVAPSWMVRATRWAAEAVRMVRIFTKLMREVGCFVVETGKCVATVLVVARLIGGILFLGQLDRNPIGLWWFCESIVLIVGMIPLFSIDTKRLLPEGQNG